MSIAHAGLIARLTPAALTALEEAAVWLDAHGCTPVIDEASAHAGRLMGWKTAPRASLSNSVDLVIAFGGDGTLLDAANAIAQSDRDVPVLGINLGHLGFLTEVGRSELTDALSAVLAGRTHTELRLLLAGHIERNGQVVAPRLALNDIVITRGALSRMIHLDVTVDGQFVSHVKADGLIVATATGSTAYNLSAGGPILLPAVDAFVLTPIAPHTLTNRPIVLPATSTIVVKPVADVPQQDVVATFDGQHGEPLEHDDSVVIRRSPRLLQLVRLSAQSPFDILREKLKWGNG